MSTLFPFAFLYIICVVCASCNKNSLQKANCAADAQTERTISNRPATIKEIAGKYYIIEQNAIDTRLLPCNLDASYAIDNLSVIVSGDVKRTYPVVGEPCCTNNFIISSITR